MSTETPFAAYFSMEVALEPAIPTYSGGLGVLAGDTLRAAADAGAYLVGVSLLHRSGYFYQRLDASGRQSEEPAHWSVDDFVAEIPERVVVDMQGRPVTLRAWKYEIVGIGGYRVCVYLLDADLPENAPEDRRLTSRLYGGEQRERLCQEAILGIGGVRLLRALGYNGIRRFHMNEGHSALLALELLREQVEGANLARPGPDAAMQVRRRCVFTTHTPVAAGHDTFPLSLVREVLGEPATQWLGDVFECRSELNMTFLGLNASHYVNGVAKKHGEVSRGLFPHHRIDHITNGVHAPTWVSKPFEKLFDQYVAGWREDNMSLRGALAIPADEIRKAHRQAKWSLLQYVNRSTNAGMDVDFLTLGFARRMTAYKRPDLLFADLERLRKVHRREKPMQILFAGKAHPRDTPGKDLIQKIFAARDALAGDVLIAFLENYDVELARLLTAGVDVWLNTPEPPLEASGTSGMKAALNGVPCLSVLDGWWIEGCIEGVTGWAIDSPTDAGGSSGAAKSLYDKLEHAIVPSFYAEDRTFIDVMRHAIALNGSFFNAQRMLQQYLLKAYLV